MIDPGTTHTLKFLKFMWPFQIYYLFYEKFKENCNDIKLFNLII